MFSEQCSVHPKMPADMEIICVTPANYSKHIQVMEMTRTYRQEHLWSVEYLTSPVEEYRQTDREKTTFVAVTRIKEFIGKLLSLQITLKGPVRL